MQDHTPEFTQPQLPFDEIQPGYCHCGCGQKTKLAKHTDKKWDIVAGQPNHFVRGHGNRQRDHLPNPNPSGMCMCGCGQPAAIADRTRIKQGMVQGQPTRFANGHTSRSIPSIEERFWKRVDKRGPDECWEWQGARYPTGHGIFAPKMHTNTPAHRYSYELHHGPIPDGMNVCHSCDNGPCVNPAHLWLGTHADNVADMVAKGRHRPNGGKLTAPQALEIRQLYANGMSQTAIGKRFDVGQTAVSSIVLRKSWKHV